MFQGVQSRARIQAVILAVSTTVLVARIESQTPVPFRSGIDVVTVTATVTDKNGRAVPGLRKEDFSVYEDGRLQTLSQFSGERAPVSLGILVDASGSMNPDKLLSAKRAISRLVSDLLEPADELFLVEFGYSARLTQEWTTDRRLIGQALADVERPTGDTALYDAIALAVPTAQSGRHGKKALLVISDGGDTRSVVTLPELRQSILESEVIVYALGIDGATPRKEKRIDADTLRRVTDETGGRTEILKGSSGLNGAMTRLADELRHQYSLGYVSGAARDGRPHVIRVELKDSRLKVRARRGYSPADEPNAR